MWRYQIARRLDGVLQTFPRMQEVVRKPWAGRIARLPDYIEPVQVRALRDTLSSLAEESPKPLVLVCDSSGGYGAVSVELAAFIRQLPVPVVTVVRRQAMSAAVLVFAAGHLRVMERGATLATHGSVIPELNSAHADTIAEIMRTKVWKGSGFRLDRTADRDFKAAMERYAGRRLPDMLYGKDFTYLTADLAQGLGLADREGTGEGFASWQTACRMMAR
jgi:hypothetical protein